MAFGNPTNNPLKDKDGRWRTASLFIERRVDAYDPLWTLKDDDVEVDGVKYPSLKKVYFSFDHTPGLEYEFAMETFKSWDHWTKLCGSQLRDVFSEWRDELDIKLKAEAIRTIIRTTNEGGAAAANAAKYLAEKGYANKRGRPAKEEVTRERKIAAGVEKELEDDLERIQLKVVSK